MVLTSRIAPKTPMLALHLKKRPPGPNDWLATHPEPGQTFDQYRRSHPSVPTKQRTTLYVQPLGEFSPAQNTWYKSTSACTPSS